MIVNLTYYINSENFVNLIRDKFEIIIYEDNIWLDNIYYLEDYKFFINSFINLNKDKSIFLVFSRTPSYEILPILNENINFKKFFIINLNSWLTSRLYKYNPDYYDVWYFLNHSINVWEPWDLYSLMYLIDKEWINYIRIFNKDYSEKIFDNIDEVVDLSKYWLPGNIWVMWWIFDIFLNAVKKIDNIWWKLFLWYHLIKDVELLISDTSSNLCYNMLTPNYDITTNQIEYLYEQAKFDSYYLSLRLKEKIHQVNS